MATELNALASLDMTVVTGTGRGRPLRDQVGAYDGGFDDAIERETLRPLLAILGEREKRILLMRFFQGMTQAEIAVKIGVSQVQVSRLLRKILEQLRIQAAGQSPG